MLSWAENLPWQRRTTHLIEIKYCEDTRPEQQLQAAHAQQKTMFFTLFS